MKKGDHLFNRETQEYGILHSVFNDKYVEVIPMRNGVPSGPPSLADIANVVLIVYSFWDPLKEIVNTVKDWLTPDPERVAARQEARRIRKEARKHLKQ
jgi:hypothetical protein